MSFRWLSDKYVIEADGHLVLSLNNAMVQVDTDSLNLLLDCKWRFRDRLSRRDKTPVPDGIYKDETGKVRYIRMSRLLCGVLDNPKLVVHVIDGDGTNMRMSNLVATSRTVIEMSKPSSTTRSGIAFISRLRKWQVYAELNCEKRYCGVYDDIDDAVAARDSGLRAIAKECKAELAIPPFEITRFRDT